MIKELIENIDSQTIDRCRRVERVIDKVDARNSIRTPTTLSHERLFAALASGQSGIINSGPFDTGWVSWIENIPPYYWLQQYERVVIDLIPCTPQEFEKKYGISIAEFVWWLENYPETILLNIRNDSWAEYEAPDVRQGMQRILSLSENSKCAASFYRLQPIRARAFERVAIPFEKYFSQAKKAVENYKQPHCKAEERLRIISRDGRWLTSNQLAARIAYYRTSTQLWSGNDGTVPAADIVLEKWLGTGDRIIDFGQTYDEMLDLQARLYTTHHLYTAHLTGALGGHYGWMAHELDFASGTHRARDIPRGAKLELPNSEWYYRLEAGYIPRPGDRIAPFSKAERQIDGLTPFQWYIKNSSHNRRVIAGNIVQLERILQRCSEKLMQKQKRDLENDRPIIGELMEELSKNRICPSKCVVAVALALGVYVGIGEIAIGGSKLSEVGKIVAALGTLGTQLGLPNILEPLQDKFNAIHCSREDRNILINIVNRLHLPPVLPALR